MSLMRWGMLLLVTGLAMAIIAALPALAIALLPALDRGIFALVAIMLAMSIAPFGAVVAVIGAVLAGFALLRRGGA